MNKNSFILRSEWQDVFACLADSQAARLIRAIFAWHVSGEEPDLSDDLALRVAWATMRHSFQVNHDNYTRVCEVRRESGKKGGRPPNQTKPNAFPDNQTKPNAFPDNQTKANGLPGNQTKANGLPGNQTKPFAHDTDTDTGIETDTEAEADTELQDAPGRGEPVFEDAEIIRQATEIALTNGCVTVSLLQRKLSLNYNQASSVVEELERRSIVGPRNDQGRREALFKATPPASNPASINERVQTGGMSGLPTLVAMQAAQRAQDAALNQPVANSPTGLPLSPQSCESLARRMIGSVQGAGFAFIGAPLCCELVTRLWMDGGHALVNRGIASFRKTSGASGHKLPDYPAMLAAIQAGEPIPIGQLADVAAQAAADKEAKEAAEAAERRAKNEKLFGKKEQ